MHNDEDVQEGHAIVEALREAEYVDRVEEAKEEFVKGK